MKLKIGIVSLLVMGMHQLAAAPDLGVIQAVGDLTSSVSDGGDAFFENLRERAYDLIQKKNSDGKAVWYFMVDVQSAQELFVRLKQNPGGLKGTVSALGQTYVDLETKKYFLTALSNYIQKFSELPHSEAYLDKITYFFTTPREEEPSFENEMNKVTNNDSLYQIYKKMNALLKQRYIPFKAPGTGTSDMPKKTVNPLFKKAKKPTGEQQPLADELAAQKKVLAGLLELVQAKDVTELKVALGRIKDTLVKKINSAIEGATVIDVEPLRARVESFLAQANVAKPVPKKSADKPAKKMPSAEQVAQQGEAQKAILIKLKQELDTVTAAELQDEKRALIQEIDAQLRTIKASGSVKLRQLQDKVAWFMKKPAKKANRPLPSVPIVASKLKRPLPSVPVVVQQQLLMLAESLAALKSALSKV